MHNIHHLARIRILDTYTAKQIAAGEIIERPACIVRELLDNSIDAGARTIEVLLQNGGLQSIRVSDDGEGMNKENLQLCTASHATSKIRVAEDLLSITSMGFRGEALASISAISRMTITSFDTLQNVAHSITVENNQLSDVMPASRNAGTQVYVEKLFHSIPVRKKFLSTSVAERGRIKTVILEKAAGYPNIALTLKDNEKIIARFPREHAFQRAVRVTNHTDTRMFIWKEPDASQHSRDSLQCTMALGLPDITAKSRKHIHIYINKRPVQSFQIMQAVEYAYKDILHGNVFPHAVLFLTISPQEIDVNIHPAKQEVRVKDVAAVRSHIIQAITTALRAYTQATPSYTKTE